jgi:hypothetical protein
MMVTLLKELCDVRLHRTFNDSRTFMLIAESDIVVHCHVVDSALVPMLVLARVRRRPSLVRRA